MGGWGSINDSDAKKGMQLEWLEQSQVVGHSKPYLLFKINFALFPLSSGGDTRTLAASPCAHSLVLEAL